MTNATYTGTAQSAKDLSYLMSSQGFDVIHFSPNDNPIEVAKCWKVLRELFNPNELQKGNPRDYRAVVRDQAGMSTFVTLPEGGTLGVTGPTSANLQQFRGNGRPPRHGISLWQNLSTGQTEEIFFWDGSQISFSDFVNFFQLNGCELNELKPNTGPDGFPSLLGTGTVISSGYEFNFNVTPRSVYHRTQVGTIADATPDEIRAKYKKVS